MKPAPMPQRCDYADPEQYAKALELHVQHLEALLRLLDNHRARVAALILQPDL